MSEEVKLTPEQVEAINEIDRNLQIVACAGSGKTEVITRRIANILQKKTDVSPENIVAFTFTEKAAASMKKRIVKALDGYSVKDIDAMYIGTIHGFCFHLLKKFTEQFSVCKVLDTVKNHLFVERYHNECGMSVLGLKPNPLNNSLFLQCIDKMIDDYADADKWTQEHRDALNKYIDCLYSHGYIDFSLMIFETLKQVETNHAIREYLSHIKYLVVDEYQDVNDLQEKLIQKIAEEGANICVVGDDDQTIYQFRGSNADNMISFSERYSDVHQVRLEKNFRCTKGIVDVADRVICNNRNRISKKMISGVNGKASEIRAERYEDKKEQFRAIAKKIQDIHKSGVPYKEIAILVRKGKVITQAPSALNCAGIPFETDSAEHFFKGNYFDRFVKTLQMLVELDKASLYECWNDIADGPVFNMGFKYLRSCSRGGVFTLSEIIYGFCEKIDFLNEETDDIDERRISLEGIIKILDDYDEIYGDWQLSARVSGVLRFLDLRAEDEYKYHSFRPENPDADAVQIMTVHKAKGLEFHTVFLPELTEREFPVSDIGGKKYYSILGGVFEQNKERYKSDTHDERKLFYVAVTRAKQNLYMTYELTKQPVSRFVKESASSPFLKINRSDLDFNPKVITDEYKCRYEKECEVITREHKPDWEAERLQRQIYWETVSYARSQLYEYYGSACHCNPAAYGDLINIKNMSPEEILMEAMYNKLI